MCATQSTYSLQSRKINYKIKKPGRLHLNQGTKVTITSNRTNIHHVNCYDTQRGTQYPFQISANCAHLNLIVRKHQAKPNQGTFVTIFKVPKVNKRLRNTSILKDDKEICQINEMWIIKDITWNNWWILNRVWKFNVNDILVFFFLVLIV